jgi:hypothetical protein
LFSEEEEILITICDNDAIFEYNHKITGETDAIISTLHFPVIVDLDRSGVEIRKMVRVNSITVNGAVMSVNGA